MSEKIKNLTIYDEFELHGYWWIPGDTSNKVAGNLKYNSDGITLKLLSNFDESEPDYFTNDYTILHGVTEHGEHITLCDGFINSCTDSFTSTSVTTIILFFNQMVFGKLFDTKKEIKFHSLSINYSSLEEWLGEHPFTRESTLEKGQRSVTYKFPPTFEVSIHKKSTKIKSSYTLTTSRKLYKSHTFKQKANLKIIPDDFMSLEWYINMIQEFQDFLTLMTNQAIYPKKIQATGDFLDESRNLREEFFIFLLPQKMFEEQKINSYMLHLNYKDIQDNLETILNNWFTDSSYSSRKIYLRNFYEKAIDQESKFLNYARSLESFHRDTNLVSGQFIPDEVYTSIKERMLDSIQQEDMEKETFNNLKNKMSNALKYAHHFGFERRIRDMFKDTDKRIKDIIFPNELRQLKEFSRNVTITRDYYTHYGEIPDYYFKDLDLYFANEKLHVILYYHFCKNLGVEDDIIWRAINNDFVLERRLKTKTEKLTEEPTK